MGMFDDFLRGVGGFITRNAPAALSLLQNKQQFDFQRDMARSGFDPMAGERGFGGATVAQPIIIQAPQQQQQRFQRQPLQFGGTGTPPVQLAPQQLPFMASPFPSPAFTTAQPGGVQMANLSLPGGAPVVGPNIIQRGMNQLLGLGGGVSFCDQVFTQGPTTVRAARTVVVQNPASGKLHWYRNMGRPVLWSGDIATAKRVDKIARRARTARRRPR